jgi:hypothetical protein
VKNFVVFPLTLTLSPAERRQPLDTFLKLTCRTAEVRHRFAGVFKRGTKFRRDYVRMLGAFLPLPGGEGRGEEEFYAKMPADIVWPISSEARS